MKPLTLLNKFREELFNGMTTRQIKSDYGFAISRIENVYHIVANESYKIQSVYDALVMIGYKYHTVVECPDNVWSITEFDGWYYQSLNIENEA